MLIDNALGLGNNLLGATFFKNGRTIRPWRGRTWRKDRCSPSPSYSADLNPISLIVNYSHCSRLRTGLTPSLLQRLGGDFLRHCRRALSPSIVAMPQSYSRSLTALSPDRWAPSGHWLITERRSTDNAAKSISLHRQRTCRNHLAGCAGAFLASVRITWPSHGFKFSTMNIDKGRQAWGRTVGTSSTGSPKRGRHDNQIE